MFVHFPDGKIHPAGAGRWIYRLLGFNVLSTFLIFLSTDLLLIPTQPANSFFLPGLLLYAGWFLGAGLLILMPILIVTPISFVQRYRKGSPLERQQIKWLVLFGGILVIYIILYGITYPLLTGGPVMTPGSNLADMVFYFSSGLFLALVIGISVLRYRLWDIDRIIHRTLVYSILTAILTLIYLGSLVVLQTIFTFFFQLGSSDLVIVLSTLAIAALFTPLRSRIRRGIDQRFFRQKYNAEQTVARFASTARKEVTVEPLAAALLNNIEESLHPEGLGLWLNFTGNKK